MENSKYLIIGNSAGGIGAAEAIREVDGSGPITIVSDEPYPAYSKPLIAEHLGDRLPVERMLFRHAGFYGAHNIRTLLGVKAVALDVDERTVGLESGRKLAWQRLLVASGGLPVVPAVEGVGLKGVFTFNRLDDAASIDRYLNRLFRRPVRAVVVGGGLIGVSAAEALVKRSVGVTIVEMKEHILSAVLDDTASSMVVEALHKAGVQIITGRTVAQISSYSGGAVTGVLLDDGLPLLCELVIVAIGVQPRLGFVSGVKTNRGIVVDRHMATSAPGVYACGDVAEAYDFVYGQNRLTPMWPNAYSGGRVAGRNMAGLATEYKGGTSLSSMKYFGLSIVSAGMVSPPGDGYETISEKRGGIYRKLVLGDGRIAGMIFAGDVERSGIVYNLMKDRTDVSSFKEVLVSRDFGLSSLPQEIWRARLSPSILRPARVEPALAGVSGGGLP